MCVDMYRVYVCTGSIYKGISIEHTREDPQLGCTNNDLPVLNYAMC